MPDHILEAEKELKAILEEKEEAIQAGDFEKARNCQERQEQTRKELKAARDKFEKRCRGKKLQVTEESISQIVAGWTRIPVEKIAEGESKTAGPAGADPCIRGS